MDLDKLIAIRRKIHAHPELAYQERNTQSIIMETLKGLRIEITATPAETGVVGLLRGASPTPVVAIRADMDALPIPEEVGVEYASQNPGVAHACGHDGHVTCALGAAMLLSQQAKELPGSVKFIFQPAEEGGAGGRALVEAGVLENPRVEAIFALHIWPELPFGKIGVKEGPIMAGSDKLTLQVMGRASHAAQPQYGVDAIRAALSAVERLSRIPQELSLEEPALVSFGMVSGGHSYNILADSVTIKGTLRSISDEARGRILAHIGKGLEILEGEMGAKFKLTVTSGYPVTSNDPIMARLFCHYIKWSLGEESLVRVSQPSMIAEDFSYYLQRVPGIYFWLGVGEGDKFIPLHHPAFNFKEEALMIGAKALSAAAKGALEENLGRTL